jgi:hypothetical protein
MPLERVAEAEREVSQAHKGKKWSAQSRLPRTIEPLIECPDTERL